MNWIVIKTTTKSVWTWIKTYWQIPFLFAWSIIIFLLSRKNSQAAIEVISAKNESYKKQINELKNRHHSEIIERDKLIEQYHKTIAEVEKKYAEKQKTLKKKEKKKIKEIVKKSKGEPHVIKAEIEKDFGFTFID